MYVCYADIYVFHMRIRYISVHSYILDFLHYATSWKVADSNSDEVIGFFNWPNLSSRTVAQGSTQPIIEMSTRNLPGGEGRSVLKAGNITASC
jgi:hypothetical protein